MNQVESLKLIDEAKDSMKILMLYAGNINTSVNLLLLNWPDAFTSFVKQDEAGFKKSMSNLVCLPLKVLSEALTSYTEQKTNTKIPLDEINFSLAAMYQDPKESKKNLIRICNNRIFTLRSIGEKIEFVEELK